MCNVLANIPKGSKAVAAAAIRTIFAQPDREATEQLSEVVKAMQPRWPKAVDTVGKAEGDVLAYMNFPPEHWTWIY